jgi:hypothetical protein
LELKKKITQSTAIDGNNTIEHQRAQETQTYEGNFLITQFLEQLFSLVIIVGSALALWKTLVLGFNTECPVVVVLTGSM